MKDFQAELERGLRRLQTAGLYRELKHPAGLDFSSNDYLAHSQHPQVIAAAEQALHQFGAGAPAARMLRGHTEAHAQAEQVAANWQQTEAALLLPSGYQANLALLSTLPRKGDVIFSDQFNHASLIDGCRLSRAEVQVFQHNCMEELRAQLVNSSEQAGRRWIVTERVFSMDGDQAPVTELLQLCTEFDAHLLLDEAHSAGIYPVLAPHPRLVSRMITGGKALGVSGALICGSRALVETLINRARNFIFTTANPPAAAAALTESMKLIMQHPERIAAIHRNAQHLRFALQNTELDLRGDGPILPIVFGDADRTMEVAGRLQAQGFDVRGVRPPTVPHGSSRLRIVVHANHTTKQLNQLASALLQACAQPHEVPSMTQLTPIDATVICGTDTGVGKTVLSALMMLQMERAGRPAHYLKPVQTGSDSDTATVKRLAGLVDSQTPPPVVELDLPASIDQAAEFQNCVVTADQVVEGVQSKLATNAAQPWVLELAGGLLVPLNAAQSQADVVQSLNFPLILAARAALGTLNHTLLTVEALRRRGLELRGVLVIGGKHPGNLKSLRGILTDIPVLEIPHFDHLDVRHLRKWINLGHLDALVPPKATQADSLHDSPLAAKGS